MGERAMEKLRETGNDTNVYWIMGAKRICTPAQLDMRAIKGALPDSVMEEVAEMVINISRDQAHPGWHGASLVHLLEQTEPGAHCEKVRAIVDNMVAAGLLEIKIRGVFRVPEAEVLCPTQMLIDMIWVMQTTGRRMFLPSEVSLGS